MNCLDFRRRLLENPFRNDAELLAHEAECPDCAPFARELRAQEAHLHALLQEVTPPPELADNIQLAVALDRSHRSRRRAWYAMAASILLIVGATFISLIDERWERGNMALAQSVFNHIQDEAHHLRAAGPVSIGRLAFVLDRFGARLNTDIGQVNFAAECLMRNRNGIHLVLPGKQGPITVFLMPGEQIGKAMPIKSDRFDGELMPTRWGSVAVVGEHGEQLMPLARKLAANVTWGDSGLASRSLPRTTLLAQQ